MLQIWHVLFEKQTFFFANSRRCSFVDWHRLMSIIFQFMYYFYIDILKRENEIIHICTTFAHSIFCKKVKPSFVTETKI